MRTFLSSDSEETGEKGDDAMKREKNSSAIVSLIPTMVQYTPAKAKIKEACERAQDYFQRGYDIKALQIAEKSISEYRKHAFCALSYSIQGAIFYKLSREAEDEYAKCTYLLGAAESLSVDPFLSLGSLTFTESLAHSLLELGNHLASDKYYEKAMSKAKRCLSLKDPTDCLQLCGKTFSYETRECLKPQEMVKDMKQTVKSLVKLAEEKMRKSNAIVVERLKSLWATMSDQSKRDFFVVEINELRFFVDCKYGSQGKEALALKSGFDSAKKSRNWKLWTCSACSEEFHCSEEFRKHLERKHVGKFSFPEGPVHQIVDLTCGERISYGNWKPVDRTEAAKRLLHQKLCGIHFDYGNRWHDWPLDRGGDRKNILKELGQILKLLFEREILSCDLWDHLITYTADNLELDAIPKDYLRTCRLTKTPQCICFLERSPLEKILGSLKHITIDVSTDTASRVVHSFWRNSRVQEKVFSDRKFSCLLLDKTLLTGKVDGFDDEGIIEVCSSSDHFAQVSPQGDDIISWLLDCSQFDEYFAYKKPVMVHRHGIWFAVLRILECKYRKLGTKYQKKQIMKAYSKGLVEVERYVTLWKGLPSGCATPLLNTCWQRAEEVVSIDTIGFLCAARDVVELERSPRFEVSEVEEYLKHLPKFSYVDDDAISETLKILKESFTKKMRWINIKIAKLEDSRKRLLDGLTKLSEFDYRLVILPLLKQFLLGKLEEMVEEMDAKDEAEKHKSLSEDFLSSFLEK